jgi:hypothetical protein
MSSGWTLERRMRQAQLIQATRPWERSTGPRTAEGKRRSSRNAFRGGVRAQEREGLARLDRLMSLAGCAKPVIEANSLVALKVGEVTIALDDLLVQPFVWRRP